MAMLSSGINCDSKSPIIIHKKTHTARYFSKIPNWTS
jgi:hypothetical protein